MPWCRWTQSTTIASTLFRYLILAAMSLVFIDSDAVHAQTSTSPVMVVSPTSLSFSVVQGGADPAPQSINVTNTGGGTLSWSSTDNQGWIGADFAGTNNGTFLVKVWASATPVGTYTGTVTVTANGYPSQTKTIPVTLRVTAPGSTSSPTIGYSPTSLAFSGTVGGANPASKSLTISNKGGGTLSWSVTDSRGWLGVSPASGTNTGTVIVSTYLSGLGAGTYNGTITISAASSTNGPQTIPVTLTVSSSSTSTKSATLTWTANAETDLAGYKIYRATSPGAYGAPIATVGKTTSYSATGLSVNTTYYFVITAYDTSGNESSYSVERSKTIY